MEVMNFGGVEIFYLTQWVPIIGSFWTGPWTPSSSTENLAAELTLLFCSTTFCGFRVGCDENRFCYFLVFFSIFYPSTMKYLNDWAKIVYRTPEANNRMKIRFFGLTPLTPQPNFFSCRMEEFSCRMESSNYQILDDPHLPPFWFRLNLSLRITCLGSCYLLWMINITTNNLKDRKILAER